MKPTFFKFFRIAIAVAVSGLGGFAVGQWIIAQYFPQTTEDKIQLLTDAIQDINKTLPAHVDAETILVSASYTEQTFTYSFRLPNFERDHVDLPAFVSIMRPTIRKAVCEQPHMQTFRELDLVIAYRYADSNNKYLAQIEVDTRICRNSIS